MANVETIQLKKAKIGELLETIIGKVMQCTDTQIYISKKLIERVIKENEKNIIWKEDVVNSFQYADNVEKSILFYIEMKNKSEVFQIHFSEDNIDFVHLSYLAGKGIMYRNYQVGMKKIIIINSD